ncbi:glycosyltransferase family 2 protein [Blastococcus sp. CT_GayMR16]|uniref:glycosyltransferase family 2 protein n=1 Tax=Blastococcus sp. CT_GayMR16 TaxID=2559607 RepID=UPI00107382A2|nr:glycosyltransferase family 2 protein [Blastococcus sp. CT_GayMR16]TFV87768.1 glycosyltransferase family 2 protein [Blastococcus sp. CT_GayMR16]
MQEPGPGVTVVVVTWQGAHLLGPCLDSLARQTVPHDVLVVDNASTDETPDVLARYPQVQVVRTSRNLGFAGGAQLGLEAARTEFVALLNNDAWAEPTWLSALLTAAQAHPEAAAITSLLLLDGTDPPRVNNAGVDLLPTLYGADRAAGAAPEDVARPAEVFGFSGGAALLRRGPAREVGGFPERYFLYYEDTDLSWRLRLAGWTIRYEPTAVVHHRHAASSDVRSPLFAFHNERNRLLLLVRCAPALPAVRAWVRFCLTTASLAVRQVLTRPPQQPHNLRIGLRTRVLLSAGRLLPWALGARRRIRPGKGRPVDPGLSG